MIVFFFIIVVRTSLVALAVLAAVEASAFWEGSAVFNWYFL